MLVLVLFETVPEQETMVLVLFEMVLVPLVVEEMVKVCIVVQKVLVFWETVV